MPDMQFGRYTFSYDHEDKIYYPSQGSLPQFSKQDVVDYYKDIADTMLRHMEGRPLTLRRFPDGIGKSGFYMQEAQDYFPDWIERVEARKADGSPIQHATARRAADLAYLASQGTLVFHIWLSRETALDKPDCLVFDLDPPGEKEENFNMVRQCALDLRDFLDELGLAPYVKLTGSKGLHVMAPLNPEADFDEVREFCRDASRVLAARKPDDYTLEQRKDKRKGRLYLDVMRNAYGQHAVAAYSLRARPGAPVSAPVSWEEVEDSGLGPRDVRLDTVLQRLEKRGDPWKDIWRHRRGLGGARKKVDALLEEEA